jgi:polysaccharide deacetylase family protein (PEP-CTERM system associated)
LGIGVDAAVRPSLDEVIRLGATDIRNALTVDVEEYFQVAAFENTIARERWDDSDSRVDYSTNRVLDLFAARGVKGTFFVLGWIAERHPDLVRRIVADGHELASHGYDHTRIHQFTAGQFRADVIKTKAILEGLGGVQVRGYRAPSYSINGKNLWALDVLQETGHIYSSSIYPIRHDLYGMPEAPRFPFRFRPDGILEIPVTTVSLVNRNFPCGGGGYFRLLPYPLFRWALKRVNDVDKRSGLFYFHPWEVDPAQPRIDGAPLKSRFRHYLNLDSMHARLEQLLGDFGWGRMDDIFLDSPAAAGEVAHSAGDG